MIKAAVRAISREAGGDEKAASIWGEMTENIES